LDFGFLVEMAVSFGLLVREDFVIVGIVKAHFFELALQSFQGALVDHRTEERLNELQAWLLVDFDRVAVQQASLDDVSHG
jgi:hypothetical protein